MTPTENCRSAHGHRGLAAPAAAGYGSRWIMAHAQLLAPPLLVCLAAASAAAQPAAPRCAANAEDHDRWAIKNQPAPATLNAADRQEIDVNEMLAWRVPINLPNAMRTSNKPITRLERERKLYARTGFVRVVKLQADCDFHSGCAVVRHERATGDRRGAPS